MSWRAWRIPRVILVVEDNEDHAELIRQFLDGEGGPDKKVYWVRDGEEALDFMRHRGAHADAPRPNLILLDLNLPKTSGLEVLKEVKEDPDLKVIPVVMLTTTDRNEEVTACYQLGVNSFVTKPATYDDYMEKLQSVRHYWLSTNREVQP